VRKPYITGIKGLMRGRSANMPKIIEFTSFDDLADYNYGVKGFEIRFQEMIEEYLEDHGITGTWWSYYNGSIFWELLEIYEKESREKDHMILANLHHYYTKVTEEVARRVKENDPVKRGASRDTVSQ
jgi:hypothetical protein